MEFLLVLIIALILLKPEDAQQFAHWLGKLWRTKNHWQAQLSQWLNNLEK